jgi:SAM-dependent methyltransferase
MATKSFEIPRAFRRGGKLGDVEASIGDTLDIIKIICRNLGIPDLSHSHVLDMGCGWRMAKTLLDHDLPIAEYVGMDVFAEMIEFLQANVADPRFGFHLLDTHNEMYNPQGRPLAEVARLNVPEGSFDIICLFSVFTHLAPHDYVAMLKLLRSYVRPDGRLIFSLFVNETSASGYGFVDNMQRYWTNNASQVAQYKDRFASHIENQGPPAFVDFDPSQPLKWAIYSRENAIQLVEGTGWEIESLNDPEKCIQHHMVCRPV